MKQSLHYTKILGILSLLLFVWGNVWAVDFSSYDALKNASTYNSTTKTYTYTGDVVVKGNISIPSDVTITIDGSLSITATTTTDVTLTVIGNLIVTGNITISGHRKVNGWNNYKYGYGILNMQGGNVVCGTWKIDGSMTCTGGGTLNLNDYSKLVNTSGISYIKANNVNQSNNAIVSYVVGTMNIIVTTTYTDNAGASNRPWQLTYSKIIPDNYRKVESASAAFGTTEVLAVRNGVNLSINSLDIVNEGIFDNISDKIETNGAYTEGSKTDLWNEQSSLLPIELTSFTAEQNGEKVDIAWTTNSEVNNDFFTVEYSIDGVTFKTLETVDGAGTTSEIQEYAISADASLFTGVVYFRLKQTDFNGNYSYSDIIALTVESETEELIVYPNPATDYVTISGNVTSAYVCDIYGKKIACYQNGNTFDVAGLSIVTYYVVVTTESGKKVLPFVKE